MWNKEKHFSKRLACSGNSLCIAQHFLHNLQISFAHWVIFLSCDLLWRGKKGEANCHLCTVSVDTKGPLAFVLWKCWGMLMRSVFPEAEGGLSCLKEGLSFRPWAFSLIIAIIKQILKWWHTINCMRFFCLHQQTGLISTNTLVSSHQCVYIHLWGACMECTGTELLPPP